MKRITKIIVFVAIALFSMQIHGQYLKLQGGLNLSNMIHQNNDLTLSSDYSNRAGFNAGLMVGVGVGPIAVEGGLLVSSKGFNLDVTDGDTKTTGNKNPIYLDIPVDLKFRVGLAGARLYGSVGPMISYGLAGKKFFEVEINDEIVKDRGVDEKIKWGSSEEDDFKKLDVGLGVGAGLELGKITLGVKYIWGLNNIAPNTDNGNKVNNRVLQFNLGIKLID